MRDAGQPPIGLHLNQAARVVAQQFGRAITSAGGSLAAWLVLLSLSNGQPATQRALAQVVGLSEATLSHHLNSMERDGLITRTRNDANRRIHDVAMTEEGARLFDRLRGAAQAFDAELLRDVDADDQARLAGLLDRLVTNVSDAPRPAPHWAGIGATALAGRANDAPPATPTAQQEAIT